MRLPKRPCRSANIIVQQELLTRALHCDCKTVPQWELNETEDDSSGTVRISRFKWLIRKHSLVSMKTRRP
jgi:hypothetical protein